MICAIDPGHQNCAWAVVDPNTREVVGHAVLRVSTYHESRDEDRAKLAAEMMIDICAHHPNVSTVIVEFQGMRRDMAAEENAILGAAYACGIQTVATIHPATIKAYYKALGCRGNRQNKIDAENAIVAMGYLNFVSHIADCLLMANYWADQQQAKI